LEGVINSDESDEEFEEKKKKPKPKKAGSKMPIKSPANRNVATKNVIKNPNPIQHLKLWKDKKCYDKKLEKKHDQKNRKYLQNIKTAKKIEKYKLKKIPHSKKKYEWKHKSRLR